MAGLPQAKRFRYKAFLSYSHAADGQLAPALQSALYRFAKPWYQLQAMGVFRDATGLGVTPSLWHHIEAALRESEYFVLLASPPAARSKWVEQEVQWWLQNRSPETLLIVWTDGQISWPDGASDFDWSVTDAVPRRLEGTFAEEPDYLELQWVKRDTDLSLRNPRFLEAVSKLAATLVGSTPGELVGEHVREYRKTRRLVRGTIAVLAVLTIVAATAAVLAFQARDKARHEQFIAETQKQVAQQQRQIAEQRRTEAEKRLAESLISKADALALANRWGEAKANYLEALTMSAATNGPGVLADIGLWAVFRQSPPPLLTWAVGLVQGVVFCPGGRTVLSAGPAKMVGLWDVSTAHLIRTFSGHTSAVFCVAISPDGRWALSGGADKMVKLWEISTGHELRTFSAIEEV
jgi:hypothetical protein